MATIRILSMVVFSWGCTAWGCWYLARAYRQGVIREHGGGYARRSDDPFNFRFWMVAWSVCLAAFAACTIYFTTLVPKAFSPACRSAYAPVDCWDR